MRPLAAVELSAPASSRFNRRKEEVLVAAGALFNRLGLRDATLAVVAAEIGLNLKSLRYYFARKEDLVSAAFLYSIGVHRELVRASLEIQDFKARIRHFTASYFALQSRIRRKEEPELVHFGDIRALTEPHLRIVGAAYVDFFRAVRRLFRTTDAPWTSEERSANAHLLVSQLLWSVIWIDGYIPADFERVADRLSDILLNGLAVAPIEVCRAPSAVPTPFASTDRLSQDSFLRAATDLINECGYRGASVDRISATLKVTKGAFYHHNETRDGLVVSCFERTFELIRQAQDLALAEESDGLSHVLASAVSLVSRQMLPEGAMLRTSALTAVNLGLRREMQHRMSLFTSRFADMLNDGMVDGSVRPCDMRIASEMVTATINSAQELQRWVGIADEGNAAALYVRPLFEGFLARLRPVKR